MMKYSVYIILFFVILGCGGGGVDNKVTPKTTVTLSAEDETIDIEKAKESIRSQLVGTEKAKFFVAPDKKDIFVLLNTFDQTALYDYDVTVYPPIQRNIIASYSDDLIVDVVVLPNGKLLYQQETSTYLTIIYIYDYILEKNFYNYYIISDGSLKLYVSKDLKQFTISGITVDISYLYENSSYSSQNFYQNYLLDVVIDDVNDLVWENAASVVEESYTLEEAKAYCRQKEPQNSWHIPTINDIEKLSIYKEQLLPYFNIYNGNNLTPRLYWIDDITESLDTAYYISGSNFSSSKSSITIILSEKEVSPLSKKLYVRCVTDLNKNFVEKK